jgi:hypothetical protein
MPEIMGTLRKWACPPKGSTIWSMSVAAPCPGGTLASDDALRMRLQFRTNPRLTMQVPRSHCLIMMLMLTAHEGRKGWLSATALR